MGGVAGFLPAMSPWRQRLWWAAGLLPALCVLFWQAGFGLRLFFFPDDVMNMLGAYRLPLWRALTDVWWPASGAYRPTGGFFYRVLYEVFGFTPGPFHIASFAVQAGNLAVLYSYAWRLSREWGAGVLVALLASYHVFLADIYASTGTIYDQLCFLFFFGALLARGRSLVGFGLCAVLAANAKELGVLLPAVVLAEDLLVWKRRPDWRSLGLAAGIGVLALSSNYVLAGEAARFEAYRPRLEWPRFSGNLTHYLGLLILRPGGLSVDAAFTLVGLLVGAAWALRDRLVWYGLLIFALGFGPALLVPQRSLYMLYLPLGGLAIALAQGMWRASLVAPGDNRVRAAILAVVWLAFWIPLQAPYAEAAQGFIRNEGRMIEDFSQAMRRAHPALPKGARIVFVADPFDRESYLIELTLPLLYQDKSLFIKRLQRPEGLAGEPLESFPYQLVYDGKVVRSVAGEQHPKLGPPGVAVDGPGQQTERSPREE